MKIAEKKAFEQMNVFGTWNSNHNSCKCKTLAWCKKR